MGGTGRASGSVGILPDLMPRASVSLSVNWAPGPPFLATILTAAPCHYPMTLSIVLFRGLTPAITGAPGGVEAGLGGGEGGLARLEYQPPTPTLSEFPHPSWIPQLNRA